MTADLPRTPGVYMFCGTATRCCTSARRPTCASACAATSAATTAARSARCCARRSGAPPRTPRPAHRRDHRVAPDRPLLPRYNRRGTALDKYCYVRSTSTRRGRGCRSSRTRPKRAPPRPAAVARDGQPGRRGAPVRAPAAPVLDRLGRNSSPGADATAVQRRPARRGHCPCAGHGRPADVRRGRRRRPRRCRATRRSSSTLDDRMARSPPAAVRGGGAMRDRLSASARRDPPRPALVGAPGAGGLEVARRLDLDRRRRPAVDVDTTARSAAALPVDPPEAPDERRSPADHDRRGAVPRPLLRQARRRLERRVLGRVVVPVGATERVPPLAARRVTAPSAGRRRSHRRRRRDRSGSCLTWPAGGARGDSSAHRRRTERDRRAAARQPRRTTRPRATRPRCAPVGPGTSASRVPGAADRRSRRSSARSSRSTPARDSRPGRG